jgi:hypothetical protein
MHGRHTRVRPHHYAAGIVTVLVALSFALVVAYVDRTGGDEPPATASSPAAGSTSSASDDSRELAGCRVVWRAQSRALGAAGSSLEQWQVHVDAMNQLVAGEITLDQAQDFWNRTRKGAAARVARFESTAGSYADSAPRCEAAIAGSRPRAASPEIADCVAGVRARDRAIDAATVAITTWKHHIMDMELLRAGQITPQQATRMWLASWRSGVRELDTFVKVRRRAADAGSC